MNAVTVTDRTCEQVLGIPWRTLRSWCREHGVAIVHIGRRPVVRVDDVLRALGGQPAPATMTDAEVVELATRRGRRTA